jgi:hypothetical protein
MGHEIFLIANHGSLRWTRGPDIGCSGVDFSWGLNYGFGENKSLLGSTYFLCTCFIQASGYMIFCLHGNV